MNKLNLNMKKSLSLCVLTSAFLLSACGSSSNNAITPDPVNKTYKVTVNNVTANQPLSPAIVVIHKPSYRTFRAGQPASLAIENLAEGGSNQPLLDEASADGGFVASISGAAPIGPGGSDSLELSTGDETGFIISVAAMLVNTNDAFVGVSSNKIAGLEVGESFRMHIPVWDAGTEVNSEAAGTMPGPADGGEGFNASRDGDANFVAIHQGVITHADGLASSVLNESHRFINPGGLLKVERIK
ncbi:MAG: spondin domain-containing protein [Cocleimonas sp.]